MPRSLMDRAGGAQRRRQQRMRSLSSAATTCAKSVRWSISSIIERVHAGEDLAFKQLQAGSTSSAAVRDLGLRIVLLARGGSVTATDDADDARSGGLHDGIHELLGAHLELRHLEDAHGPIPQDGLGLLHRLGVHLNRFGAAIQAHEAIGDARLLSGFLDLAILA